MADGPELLQRACAITEKGARWTISLPFTLLSADRNSVVRPLPALTCFLAAASLLGVLAGLDDGEDLLGVAPFSLLTVFLPALPCCLPEFVCTICTLAIGMLASSSASSEVTFLQGQWRFKRLQKNACGKSTV